MRQVNENSSEMLKLARKHGVKIGWGTDLFGPPAKQALQPMEFKARAEYFTPVEIFRQATSLNCC